MRALIFASLVLNILVLVPVCYGLLTNGGWTLAAYGPDTPARGIVLAVYASILVVSAGLVLHPVPPFVAALLTVQIIYKLLTPLTVGSLENPVVISNIAIAVLHGVTLWSIWRNTNG